jgi:hypothetical protein
VIASSGDSGALSDTHFGKPVKEVSLPASDPLVLGVAVPDATTGSNYVTVNSVPVTAYSAGPGWDPVTGWGSPDAQVLIPLLARG